MAPVSFLFEGADVGEVLGAEGLAMLEGSVPGRAVGDEDEDVKVEDEAVALGFTLVSLPLTSQTPFPSLQHVVPFVSKPQQ